MYRCNECGRVFDEPVYEEVCMEDYCGVGRLFSDRHYKTFANCPYCNSPIDIYYDLIDEDDIDEYDT